jgi:hypothetical protein
MDNDRTSLSLHRTDVVAQRVEQPPAELWPGVRIAACLAFAVVAVTAGITIGYFFRVAEFDISDHNLNYSNPGVECFQFLPGALFLIPRPKIYCFIDLISVDANARTMTWDWTIWSSGLPDNTITNLFFDT